MSDLLCIWMTLMPLPLLLVDSGPSLLPCTCKLLYQLIEVSGFQELEGIVAGSGALAPTAVLLSAVLSMLHELSLHNQQAFTKVCGGWSCGRGQNFWVQIHWKPQTWTL